MGKFDLHIVNYKIHFQLDTNLVPKITYLDETIRMTVYKSAPYLVHFTGFKELGKIPYLKHNIWTQNKNIKIQKPIIDAIMLSRKGDKSKYKLKYPDLIKHVKSLGGKVEYEPELFPGLRCRFENLPTITIFRSTSAQCLGVRNTSQIEQINTIVNWIFSLSLNHHHQSDQMKLEKLRLRVKVKKS